MQQTANPQTQRTAVGHQTHEDVVAEMVSDDDRYEQWLLAKAKEEWMLTRDQIQEWEYDFTPDPATNVCQECGQVHLAETSVTKKVWEFDEEVMYFFCSHPCLIDFYLRRLREAMP